MTAFFTIPPRSTRARVMTSMEHGGARAWTAVRTGALESAEVMAAKIQKDLRFLPAAAAPGSACRRLNALSRDEIPLRNFLIVVPEPTSDGTPSGHAQLAPRITALARRLNTVGYAYVAWPGQGEMTDDSFGVRYLPLGEQLPAFGAMTAVVVVGSAEWAAAAEATYSGAAIFRMDLKD